MSGVNVNASDEQQRTALHFSASKGYSQVVNLLLQVSFRFYLFQCVVGRNLKHTIYCKSTNFYVS